MQRALSSEVWPGRRMREASKTQRAESEATGGAELGENASAFLFFEWETKAAFMNGKRIQMVWAAPCPNVRKGCALSALQQ